MPVVFFLKKLRWLYTMLNWCVVYTSGRLNAHQCDFSKLNVPPFEHLNKTAKITEGFFFKNYSPGGSQRMYFTAENAGKIDYFRSKIEEWKNAEFLAQNEYNYLLASLIDSVSDVSNTAGVYGAFLKKWDPRALKPIVFHSVDFTKEGASERVLLPSRRKMPHKILNAILSTLTRRILKINMERIIILLNWTVRRAAVRERRF
jgi:adenine-specific DNA methylase